MKIQKRFTIWLSILLIIGISNSCRVDCTGSSSRGNCNGKDPFFTSLDDNKNKISLKKLITNTNLGEIETNNLNGIPSKQEVKNKLKKLYPDLDLSEINIYVREKISICPRYLNIGLYKDDVDLSYTPLCTRKKLTNVITDTNLGEIETNNLNGIPSNQEVKNKLKKLYPDLDLKEITICPLEKIYENIYIYIYSRYSDTCPYDGNVTLSYTPVRINNNNLEASHSENSKDKRKDLRKIIKINELVEFETTNISGHPSEEDVKNKLKKLYCDDELDTEEIKIEIDRSNQNIKIYSLSDCYAGELTLTYSPIPPLKELKDLKDIIPTDFVIKITTKNQNNEPSEEETKARLSFLLPELDLDKVIISITHKDITISANYEDPHYTGSVIIRYIADNEYVSPTNNKMPLNKAYKILGLDPNNKHSKDSVKEAFKQKVKEEGANLQELVDARDLLLESSI